MLTVCETFKSIQGESTLAGEVCAFVRLAGCNLSCVYCDSRYARTGGTSMSVDDVCAWVRSQECRLVEITGGEPLLQKETAILAGRLCDDGHTVLVETNGSKDISMLPEPCIRILDVKSPASGAGGSLHMPNLNELRPHDECKFVLCDRADFEWAVDFVAQYRLAGRCTIIFSPAWNILAPKDLAAWMLEKNTVARLGLQVHKFIWGDARGR
ncbi:MAG TPA: radical SAM protein [Chitinivibrionales bacterium]|nr:radical SAM protein [Chitinivibrionales bacterium]